MIAKDFPIHTSFIDDFPINILLLLSLLLLLLLLVGGFNPSEKCEFVSWDDDIPNIC